MRLIITKHIGRTAYPFSFEGKNLHECVMESKKLSFRDVKECELCRSDNLYLDAYVTEKDGYEYTKIRCAKCSGSITFGRSRKSPDTFYLRRNDDKSLAWEAPQNQGVTQQDKKATKAVINIFISYHPYLKTIPFPLKPYNHL